MFRKLTTVMAVLGAAALLVPAAFAAGGFGPGAGTGTCPQAGTCVPKLDGTGPGARGTGTGTCVPKLDGTGPANGTGYQGMRQRGAQGTGAMWAR